MSAAQNRRGFLRGLVSLPLIGGGVTLIGNPSAAAVPVTPELLTSYNTWLEMERRHLLAEMYGHDDWRHQDSIPWNNGGSGFYSRDYGAEPLPEPSTRAAVVLSAVGCHWVWP